MRPKKNYLLLFFIVIVLLEAIDPKKFLITIPGFPLSLGRLCFVATGVYFLFINKLNVFKSPLLTGVKLIYLGLFLSAIFTGSDISETLGIILLVIGSIGNVYLWEKLEVKKLVNLFFIIIFSYWLFSSFNSTLIFDLSYSELDSDLINHHVPGLIISVSAAFISIRFFYKKNTLNVSGYLIYLLSIIACLYIESRSNFIFSLISLLFVSLMGKKDVLKFFFKITPIIITIFIVITSVINSKESLQRRFTQQDQEYQERTTSGRFDFISIGLDDFLSNPLIGKGVENSLIMFNGNKVMLHNQYLTFMLGGGIITLVGLVFFLTGLAKLLIGIRRLVLNDQIGNNIWVIAIANSCLIFFLTLVTIENGGILFYVLLSMVLYCVVKIKNINDKNKRYLQ